MIVGVSLNPCIDRTLSLETFACGETNRVQHTDVHYAGKTFNALRILSALGKEARAIGVLGRDNGEPFVASLAQSDVACEPVWFDGETRTNIKLLDLSTKTITEVNDGGAPLPEEAIEAVLEKVHALPEGAFLLLNGRLPPGCSSDTYRRIMQAAGPHVRAVVDAEGDSLTQTLGENPWLIKPNRRELEQIAERELPSIRDVLSAARELIAKGARLACVSLGEQGALLATESEGFYAFGLDVPVTSTVGAGDAMVAGLIAGSDLPLDAQLKLGMACSAASVANNRVVTPDLIERYLERVQTLRI